MGMIMIYLVNLPEPSSALSILIMSVLALSLLTCSAIACAQVFKESVVFGHAVSPHSTGGR